MDGSYLEHDGHLSELAHRLQPVSIVDPVVHTCAQLSPVADMSLSALGGEDVAVADRNLVRWGQYRLVQEHVHDLDAQSVAAAHVLGLGIWVAIEEDLCANLLDSFVDVAALHKDLVEGVNVRVDGSRERRIGGAVLGRVLEELLASRRVELS